MSENATNDNQSNDPPINRVNHAGHRMNRHGRMFWYSYNPDTKTHDRVYVYRLLAVAEHGFDAVCDKVIHHESGIPWDDRPDNIELMEHGEHSRMENLGERHHRTDLTADIVREIRRLADKSDLSQSEIGERYGITQAQVSNIVLRKQWGHVD